MELKMEVYTPALELVGLLSVFRSVMWEEAAFTAGTFSVESILSDESISLLVPENIVWIGEDVAGIIEYIQTETGGDTPSITAKGRLLTGILDRRILWGMYNLNGEPPALMYDLVSDCAINPTRGDTAARVISGLALDGDPPPMPGAQTAIVGTAIVGTTAIGSTGFSSIRKQKTGGSLLEALEELGAPYQVAFGVRFDASSTKMLFWARPGVDRTIRQTDRDPVFFSTELDDVLTSEYSYDSSEYKNITLVAGEDTGDARASVVAVQDDGGTATGLDRREMYVDARDLQSESTGTDGDMTEDEYAETLETRGLEKLAEQQLVKSFSAVVRTYGATYEYGSDFLLGDTITVTDERLGLSVSAVVQAVSRTVSQQGEDMELTLGYSQPTVHDLLKRKAGK